MFLVLCHFKTYIHAIYPFSFIFAIFETLKLLEEKKTLEEDESSPYS